MYQRIISNVVYQVSNSFPVLLVTGPRQVGKTTLLQTLAESNRNYVTLDDFDVRQLAQNDPNLFIQKYKAPIIIDEIQYAPQLLSYIKIAVDKEKKNGAFWLTGSQKFHLIKGLTESLAGRVAVLDLLGLSQAELDGRIQSSLPFLPTHMWLENRKKEQRYIKDIIQIYKQIWLGSFPKVNTEPLNMRELFYKSYIQTYIKRDIEAILSISNEMTFYSFLTAVAARTGQILNYTDLARDVGIDTKTAKAWLSTLEMTGLVYLLKPYYNNLTKRLTKSPKLYFLDTGLCAYLTKWTSPESLEKGAMSGAILETYIFSEILKTYINNGLEPYFYYYRDSHQKEIDLIIEDSGTLYPVEFKKTATPSLNSFKNFDILEKLGKKVGHGAVICLKEEDIPLSKNVDAIPVTYI